MTILFEDGLESGNLVLWNGTVIQNGTVTVDSVYPHTGSFAAHFLTSPTLQAANALANKSIVAPEVYARAYVFVNQGIPQMGAHDRFYVFYVTAADGSLIAAAGLRREGTNPLKWILWCRGRQVNGVQPHVYGNTLVSQTAPPAWICVEAHYSKSTGVYELFINGALEISVTAPAIAPNVDIDVARIDFGVIKTGATGTAYDPTGTYTIELFGDDLVVADTYIGPTPSAQPKLTVNSSPELNVPVYVDGTLVGNTPLVIEVPSGTHTVRVEEEVSR